MTFTVIIPHKNCPELLKRCIDSIPSKEDIEVIVIDDNSSCLEELKTLSKFYESRNVLFLFTSEGKGAGFARNQGLSKATGKWLLFSDSDDFFTEDAFKSFYEYKDSNCDLIAFKHCSAVSDTGERTNRSEARNNYIDSFIANPNEASESKLRLCNDVPWAKMIRRTLVETHNIKFDEVPASNDTTFSLMAGYFANSILADAREVYCVTVREGSITRTKSVDRYFSDHCVALRKNKFVREVGHPECQEIILSRLMLVLKIYGLKEFIRFMKEVKRYKGRLFYGVSRKLKIEKK